MLTAEDINKERCGGCRERKCEKESENAPKKEYREYMAFVDLLLRLLGEDPIAYYPEDKWSTIFAMLVNRDHFFMPWILGGIPLLWLVVKKWQKKPISKINIIVAVLLAAVLGFIGFFLLNWIL